jgi:glycosyltransferase involved in cell wall biosynthesis
LAVFGPAVRRAGIALVGWRHDAYNGFHWLEWWASLTPPDLMICNSRYTETTYRRFAPGVRTSVLHYPVAPPRRASAETWPGALRASVATAPDDVVLLQVSRMEQWKGHVVHLQALSMLREMSDWTLWVAGGAQREHERRYLERLKRLAHDLGIAERVRFLGERQDVAKLLAAADIFCQPNTGPEPFGIVFIEALYAGLPVVTSAIGGALEIVDDTCGRLVKPGDPEGLGAVLRNLIADAALRERLGAAGPARAHALCDPEAQMDRLASILEKAGKAVTPKPGAVGHGAAAPQRQP